jgi:hypothetical protein
MNVKATETQLGDTFRQKLYALNRIAENNTLIDVELLKEGVKAMYFLPFLYKRIILRNT